MAELVWASAVDRSRRRSKQTALSVVLVAAVFWPSLVIGIVVPAVTS
jgi:predicted anti-sigma-YlaC factor YlaD